MTDDLSTDTQYIKSLGTTTDAPASTTVPEDTTARSQVSLLKGIKNLLIDSTRNIVGHSKTMTGSAVALSAISVIYQDIYLLAVGAAGTTYVGDAAVTAGHGIPLSTTTALHLEGPIDLANIYAIGTGPDEVAMVCFYEV